MTYKIRLKVGFFKTELFVLEINSRQIALKPHEKDTDSIVIKDSELQSVGFITSDTRDGELEIVTTDAIYRGSLVDKEDFTRLSEVLYQEFGSKFVLHKGILS